MSAIRREASCAAPPQQRERRQALADAANVSFRRATVVLYLCAPRDHRPAVLASLRDYALVRDWAITAEITEPDPGGDSAEERPGWNRVLELIASGHAQGVLLGAAHCQHPHPHRAPGAAFLIQPPQPRNGNLP